MDQSSYSGVDIIVLNYNNWKDTISCLESIFLNNYKKINVIVVDNASQDNSIERISEWASGNIEAIKPDFKNSIGTVPKPIKHYVFTDITKASTFKDLPLVIISNSKNTGYAGGNNIGLKYSLQSPNMFKWILNNDTYVNEDSLEALLNFANKNPNIGIIGSKLLFYHAPHKIQAIGGRYNKFTGAPYHIGENLPESTDTSLFKIDYPVGASLFLNKKFIQQVGLMNEEYFLYFEELDWVQRAQKKDIDFGYCAESVIYHKEGATSGVDHLNSFKSELSDYWSLRNRLVFSRKYYKAYLPFVYISFTYVILNRIRRRQFKRLPQIIKLLFTHEVVR